MPDDKVKAALRSDKSSTRAGKELKDIPLRGLEGMKGAPKSSTGPDAAQLSPTVEYAKALIGVEQRKKR